jgi:ribonuclease D
MLADQLLEAGKPHELGKHSLKGVAKRYLDLTLSKAEQVSDWGREVLEPEQLDYAANDVVYLPVLYERLRGDLRHEELLHILTRIELPLLAVTVERELYGMPFALEPWRDLSLQARVNFRPLVQPRQPRPGTAGPREAGRRGAEYAGGHAHAGAESDAGAGDTGPRPRPVA